MSKTFSTSDVASHSKPNDLFIIVDEDVYDLTNFQDEHPGTFPSSQSPYSKLTILPGGKKILTRVAGKDASKQFWKYHNEGILKKYKGKLQVGSLDTKKAAAPPTPPPSPPAAKEVVKPQAESGAVVPVPAQDAAEAEALDPFGDLIPFADPTWYQGVRSPPLHLVTITDNEGNSTTPPTSTNPTPLSAKKSAPG